MTEFAPAWFLPGPHFQTVWGRIARARHRVQFERESFELPDGDELVLDHVQSSDATATHFVLMHGLEGSSYSVYMQGLLGVITRLGHGATAINFRSCARDPHNILRMLPNRRPRLYHSGDTADFDAVVRMLATRIPHKRLLGIGTSLGGNVLLKWLGENPGQTLLSAAATLSVPYDLGAGSALLEKTVPGRFYVSRFLATLKKKATRPDIAPRLDVPRVLRSRTFRELDDAATAPLHGFAGAAEYYERASSIAYLGNITTPTLALSAEDDPFLPPDVLPIVRRNASAAVDFRTTPFGGHAGFISGRAPWRCQYWAEELVVRWLLEQR